MMQPPIEATAASGISDLVSKITPIRKLALFSVASEANEPILTSPLSPTRTDATFIITIALRTADRVAVSIAHSGVSQDVFLNSGFPLEASCLYSFTLPVPDDCKVNLKTESANVVKVLMIHETGIMV